MFKGSGSSKYSRACLGQYQHPLRLRCQPWNRRQYVGPLPVTRQDWDASWHSSTQHTALIVLGCRVRSRVKSESSALHGAQKTIHSPSSSRNVAQPLIQHRQDAQGITPDPFPLPSQGTGTQGQQGRTVHWRNGLSQNGYGRILLIPILRLVLIRLLTLVIALMLLGLDRFPTSSSSS